jgi:hypothetical protein
VAAGSACPCASCGPSDTRDTGLHFLEAVFFRRVDESAITRRWAGAGRSGDTFYRCRVRNGRHDVRDVYLCRGRVTDERGVVCPLCRSLSTITVRLVANGNGSGGNKEVGSSSTSTRLPHAAMAPGLGYAVMDDLTVSPMVEGLSRTALLEELGVADPATVCEEVVHVGYKQVRHRATGLGDRKGDAGAFWVGQQLRSD